MFRGIHSLKERIPHAPSPNIYSQADSWPFNGGKVMFSQVCVCAQGVRGELTAHVSWDRSHGRCYPPPLDIPTKKGGTHGSGIISGLNILLAHQTLLNEPI